MSRYRLETHKDNLQKLKASTETRDKDSVLQGGASASLPPLFRRHHLMTFISVCGSLHCAVKRFSKPLGKTQRLWLDRRQRGMMGTYKLPLLGRLSSFWKTQRERNTVIYMFTFQTVLLTKTQVTLFMTHGAALVSLWGVSTAVWPTGVTVT